MRLALLFIASIFGADSARSSPHNEWVDRWVTASWYDEGPGKPTAFCGLFSGEAMIVAHPFLPKHTKLRVFNPKTKREVVVEVCDRGPAKWVRTKLGEDRLLDATPRVWRELGLTPTPKGDGVATLYVTLATISETR